MAPSIYPEDPGGCSPTRARAGEQPRLSENYEISSIQSALREWAYGIVYNHSTERAAMLERWTHHHNWHRPHQGIGGLAPISRLAQSRNRLDNSSTGTITDEMIKECIEEQQGEQMTDDSRFSVDNP